jgi:hypothetical protein
MLKQITFSADDIDNIQAASDTPVALQEYIDHLKDAVKDIAADETINLELSEELVEASELASEELDDASGIFCHIYCSFNNA